jgi:ATP-binding protein involved in chromosome partitioning
MATPTEKDVLAALAKVADPDKGKSIVELGMVKGLQIRDGHVAFALEVEPERGAKLEPLRREAEKAVNALPGVATVTAVLTAERARAPSAAGHHGHQHGHQHGPAQGAQQAPVRLLTEIGAVIAVASGKGGVGKSTTAVNLALALSALGHRTGILDADIYGPSLPRMLGIKGKPVPTADGKKLKPMEKHGLVAMSMGFLLEEETPVIWRGPMVMGALEQMMRDVEWGPLDVMIVDMPPGTGDTQLTMSQRVPLKGAVIVSTPQDIALLDARRGYNMFKKVNVPVLGLIENMSYFICPHCNGQSDIFGHGGAKREAEKTGMDFLGEIPLDIVIRETSDAGDPVVVSRPDGPHAKAYKAIAQRVWDKVSGRAGQSEGPRIVIQ